jgi:hypothetical protein
MNKPITIRCESGNIVDTDGFCDVHGCPSCCEHWEWDHDICMDCGKERDVGAEIDRAMDYGEDR